MEGQIVARSICDFEEGVLHKKYMCSIHYIALKYAKQVSVYHIKYFIFPLHCV